MKKSHFIIIVVFLVVITAVNFFILLSKQEDRSCACSNAANKGCYVSSMISLDENQKQLYDGIKSKYRNRAILVADSLHLRQERLMRSLMRNESDTNKIAQIEKDIVSCQKELLHLSVEQYYEIKAILNPSQIPVLDSLFAQIFICRPTCNHRSEDGGTHPHLN